MFQHQARDEDTHGLEKLIVQVTDRCINRTNVNNTYPVISDTLLTVVQDYYKILKTLLDEKLYCRTFNLKENWSISDQLTWKWSEATGKYVGCPFWSVRAEEIFKAELERRFDSDSTSLDDAWNLGEELSRRRKYGDRALTHEHVFPRAELSRILHRASLFPQYTRDADALENLFRRLAIGCVVLESEHRQLSQMGDPENPWKRYTRGVRIAVVNNPLWREDHREMIEEAGLVG